MIELDNDIEPPAPIPEVALLVNDVVPLELNIIQSTDCDKFVSINYRHADNSRHTVQIEQFYIEALKAIGITDTSKFVAENAGVATVTKNVKRAIVLELVKRATVSPATADNELNITHVVNDAPATPLYYVSDGRCTIRTAKGAYCTKPDYNNSGYCKQHFNARFKVVKK